MIEVVFGKSAEGCLKCAQNCGKSTIGEAVSVIVFKENGSKPSKKETKEAAEKAMERRKRLQEQAVSLGGRIEDIFCISDNLSEGDISGNTEVRKNELREKFKDYPFDLENILKDFDKTRENIKIIKEKANEGETVRIWYSSSPSEYCGMYFLLYELKKSCKTMPKIKLMFLPDLVKEGNRLVSYGGWGGVPSELWHKFLYLEEDAGEAFFSMAYAKWEEMKKDNAPLRVFINGKLQSVNEDFYDVFIEREIKNQNEEFKEANLVGNILGKYQFGIGDIFIAGRIDKMIKGGKLQIVKESEDKETPYRRILKKI